MDIRSWPSGVNRIITSESNPTIGLNAVIADKADNGQEVSRLASSGVPDQWAITMYFSNSTEDPFYKAHGKTEWETFQNWFKYNLSMGVLPFYFARLQDCEAKTQAVYKIISKGVPKGTPNGTWIKCQMTWSEIPLEFISINFPENQADCIDIYNGLCDFRFVEQPSEIPSKYDFSFTFTREFEGDIYEKDSPLVMEKMDYDGYKSCQFYFPEKTMPGIYHIKCVYGDQMVESQFEVEQ